MYVLFVFCFLSLALSLQSTVIVLCVLMNTLEVIEYFDLLNCSTLFLVVCRSAVGQLLRTVQCSTYSEFAIISGQATL